MSVKEDHPIAVGRIRLEVPKLAELKAPVKSTVVSIANMPWSLEVMSECSKRTSDTKKFSIYINCNEDNKNPHWSCQASIGFNLMSSKVGLKSLSKTFVHTFRTTPTSKGLPSFIAWDKVLDPENGFIREGDDGVVVEATVTVTKVVGLPVSTLCDFTAPQPNLTDVALIVEEKPLHVIKTYLACHSPVFHSMFFSEFAEKEKKEIPLPDVTYDEFVELLHVIFPSRKPVTAFKSCCIRARISCVGRTARRFRWSRSCCCLTSTDWPAFSLSVSTRSNRLTTSRCSRPRWSIATSRTGPRSRWARGFSS